MADPRSVRSLRPLQVKPRENGVPYFKVHLDYETSERAGAGGTFQVFSITDENEDDRTDLVDQGIHFHTLDELKVAIAKGLSISPKEVDLDEV
jgi:type I restriction enzyme S subunit